jgi:hypothetical protein
MTENVILSDISEHGCRIYGDAVTLRLGQRLIIKPARFESIEGSVRWVAGPRAGVAFDHPLHTSVAAHMQQLYAVPSHPDTQTNIRVLSASLSNHGR